MSQHWLVVEDDGDDTLVYTIDHPAECPTYDAVAPGPKPEDRWIEYDCGVGFHVVNAGLPDAFGREWPKDGMRPGRYEIEVWSETFPSTPYHGEEWDGGLRFVDIEKLQEDR